MTSLDCPQNTGSLPGRPGTGPNAAPTGVRDERQSRQVRESYRGQDREVLKDDRHPLDRYRPRSVERDGPEHNRGRSRFTRDDEYRESQSSRRDQKHDDNGRWKERRRSRSLDSRSGGGEKRRRVG
jgi:hypothetical protein